MMTLIKRIRAKARYRKFIREYSRRMREKAEADATHAANCALDAQANGRARPNKPVDIPVQVSEDAMITGLPVFDGVTGPYLKLQIGDRTLPLTAFR